MRTRARIGGLWRLHVSEGALADDRLDEEAIESFSVRLDAYAATLPERERKALELIMLAAMDPHSRMQWRNATDVLSAREEAELSALASQQQEG